MLCIAYFWVCILVYLISGQGKILRQRQPIPSQFSGAMLKIMNSLYVKA